MPLWEAFFETDPPVERRIDNAAWQTSRAAKARTIHRSEFDGREPRDQVRQQPPAEMAAEATKIESTWPHKKQG